MNNIDYLVKQSHHYSTKQCKFFQNKNLKLDFDDNFVQNQIITSPTRQHKYIVQLMGVDYDQIQKVIQNEIYIEILELKECKLRSIPPLIYQMPRLKILKLEGNFIKIAPPFEVEVLSLKNNLLITYQAHPKVLKLDLSLNKIQSFEIGSQIIELHIQANEFIYLPVMPKTLQLLELDWFKYTEPPLEPLQKPPLIEPLYLSEFSAIDFLTKFSRVSLTNKIKQAALDSDLGMITCMAKWMDIDEGEDESALSIALKNECLFSVRHLIELGANINKGKYKQGNIISYIIENELMSILNMILPKATLDTFQADQNGNTPLHYLVKVQYDEVNFKIITKAKCLGVGLSKNNSGLSPLHLAIMKFKNSLIKQLLMTFNLSEEDDDLFQCSCQFENFTACTLLIQHNIQYSTCDKSLVFRNIKFYKTLLSYEQFRIKQKLFEDVPKTHYNYEVKLLSGQKLYQQQDQTHIKQLRQLILFKKVLTAQQTQFIHTQLKLRINDINKLDLDYYQLLCEILITLYFNIDASFKQQVQKQLYQYQIGQHYLYNYVKLQHIPNDLISQYEYYQY